MNIVAGSRVAAREDGAQFIAAQLRRRNGRDIRLDHLPDFLFEAQLGQQTVDEPVRLGRTRRIVRSALPPVHRYTLSGE